MTTRFSRSKFALTSGAIALLLSMWGTTALADHGLIDAEADMKDPAAEPTEENLQSATENIEDEIKAEEEAIPVSDPSGIALRLPGVSEEDQPRFRRQMNRTDI